MKLTGYGDRFSVRPGETITFHVHSVTPTYQARLVQLIHGDENPIGPGFKEIEIASALDGIHSGQPRTIRKGSYGIVLCPVPATSFVLDVWIWPTLPGPDGREPGGEHFQLGYVLDRARHQRATRPRLNPRASRASSSGAEMVFCKGPFIKIGCYSIGC